MKRDSARTANALWRWAAAELLLLSMALNGGVSTVYAVVRHHEPKLTVRAAILMRQ